MKCCNCLAYGIFEGKEGCQVGYNSIKSNDGFVGCLNRKGNIRTKLNEVLDSSDHSYRWVNAERYVERLVLEGRLKESVGVSQMFHMSPMVYDSIVRRVNNGLVGKGKDEY